MGHGADPQAAPLVGMVGTDDRAKAWRYRWHGFLGVDLPPATLAEWAVYLAMAVPAWTVLIALAIGSRSPVFAVLALVMVVGTGVGLWYLMRHLTRKVVTRDRNLHHHRAAFWAEVHGRRPQRGETVRVALSSDVLEIPA